MYSFFTVYCRPSLFQVSNFRSDGSPSYNNERVINTTDLNLLWHYYRYSLTSLYASTMYSTRQDLARMCATRHTYAVQLEYIGIRVSTSLVISWKLSRDPAINPLRMAYQGLIITLSIPLYIYIYSRALCSSLGLERVDNAIFVPRSYNNYTTISRNLSGYTFLRHMHINRHIPSQLPSTIEQGYA